MNKDLILARLGLKVMKWKGMEAIATKEAEELIEKYEREGGHVKKAKDLTNIVDKITRAEVLSTVCSELLELMEEAKFEPVKTEESN